MVFQESQSLPSSSNQSRFHTLVCSLKLSSPTWVEALVPVEKTQRSVSDCYVYLLRKNLDCS